MAGLGTAAAVGLLGAPVGLVWAALSPRAELVVRQDGPGLRELATKDFIAADGALFLLGVAAGVAVAVLAWRSGRSRPLGVVVGLVVGSALAALLAWQVGVRTDDRDGARAAVEAAQPGAVLEVPLQLRSRAALLGWPAAAALTWAVLALRRPDLLPGAPVRGPGGRRQLSWGRPGRG